MRIRPRNNLEVLCLALGLSLAALQQSALAGTVRVPTGVQDIQEAIDGAEDGDTVCVSPGEYVIREPLNFNRLHDPDDPLSPPVKNITLRSEEGREVTIIRMADDPEDPNRASVVIFENGETGASLIEGFTLSGGDGTVMDGGEGDGEWKLGGGVLCAGGASPTISRCSISGNTAEGGGGFGWVEVGTSPTLLDSVVADNSASRGAGGGGLLWWSATGTIRDCEIRENTAQMFSGGGLSCERGSTLELFGSAIVDNVAAINGGGVFVRESMTKATIEDCTIENNTASGGSGGGLACHRRATLEISECSIFENTANVSGGALSYVGNATGRVTDCVIERNAAVTDSGGGTNCAVNSRLDISESILLENVAGAVGGGMMYWGGSGDVERCQIRRNVSVGGIGGGVFCGERSSPHFKSHTVISENAVFDGAIALAHGGGLAIFRSPGAIIEACVVEGNYSEYAGGGVDFWDDEVRSVSDQSWLLNSIVSGNSAEVWGGGVTSRGFRPSMPRIDSCSIANNSAAERGGVAKDGGGDPTMASSIVWNNTPESAEARQINCLVGEDPLFVAEPEHDFGRFEDIEIAGFEVRVPSFVERAGDYHLREGSPAIDAGFLDLAPEVDFDGTLRPQGEGVDIGAYEFEPEAVLFLRGDTNSDRSVDLSDAVAVLNFLFLGGEAPTCLPAANSNADAEVNIADSTFLLNHLFLGGPAPAAPYPDCGPADPETDEELVCEESQCS